MSIARGFLDCAKDQLDEIIAGYAHAAGDETADGKMWIALMSVRYGIDEAIAEHDHRFFGRWGPIRRRWRRLPICRRWR